MKSCLPVSLAVELILILESVDSEIRITSNKIL